MKRLSLFLLLFSFSSFSLACENPASERDLFALFHVNNQPTTWRSVKGSTYQIDRGTKIFIHALDSVARSTVEFKDRTYTISQVQFCNSGNSRITVTHPDHGELRVRRSGRGDGSVITLSRNAFLSFKLRPIQLTTR